MLLVHQNTGKENRYGKKFFAVLISTLGRFDRANKKKICHIHFKRPIYHFPATSFNRGVVSRENSIYYFDIKYSERVNLETSIPLEVAIISPLHDLVTW